MLLQKEWRVYKFSFYAETTINNAIRLTFILGGEKGSYYFDDIHMHPSAIHGLGDNESLADGSVQRIRSLPRDRYIRIAQP